MAKTITLVEINVYQKMVPLVSGYLEAYARRDPHLESEYRFTKYTATRTTPFQELLDDLVQQDADVYGFSCYIWNMGLVKSLLRPLVEHKPGARFVLGGPQVMHHAPDYLEPEWENVAICNGEGERTFSNLLSELTNQRPDLSAVKGLSFYRDNALVNTEREERIPNLDDIPSPFLNALFDTTNYMSVIETNRGCPFHCGFCYWGAANNDRVYRFDEERVREEIRWISGNGTPTILIADANWGMLKRDIGLSEHIAACRDEFAAPVVVHFSAAKNSPHRVAEITKIFKRAGLFSPQPISMQSLDETTLETITRKNIKIAAFEELQEDLNESGIGSYIELIWPLPGETLASFMAGISSLCERRAHTIVVYIHLLLHNTPLHRRKEELGLVTRPVRDGLAEADIVVQTAEVNAADFEDGMRFIYTTKVLYNTRILHALSRYLHETGTVTYGNLYHAFVEFCKRNSEHPFVQFCEQSIADALYYDITNYPTGYWLVLHDERQDFEDLVYRFVSSRPWWDDENARALFEIDQLAKPFLYSNTPFVGPTFPLEHLDLIAVADRSYVIGIPDRFGRLLAGLVPDNPVFGAEADDVAGQGVTVYRVDHKRRQHRHSERQNREARADYCSGVISRLSSVLPVWSKEAVQSRAGGVR